MPLDLREKQRVEGREYETLACRELLGSLLGSAFRVCHKEIWMT